MTIKELSTRAGISAQAVYKRLKANGLNLDELRDKETGHFTAEGLEKVESLFQLDRAEVESVDQLKTQVEKLKIEVERLKTQVESVTNERDYLREALSREQALQMAALQKGPALPSGRVRSWWDRIRGRAE